MAKSESQPVLEEGAAVFTCGDNSYTDRDVIDAGFFRGELEPIWKELLLCVECENQSGEAEMDDSAIDSAVESVSLRPRLDHGGGNRAMARGAWPDDG